MYKSLEELCENVPQYILINHMTDEQMESAFRDAYFAGETVSISEDVKMFLHQMMENTDMASEYAADEAMPTQLKDVPAKGKTRDIVEYHWKHAFLMGIEYAVCFMLGQVDKYFD